MLMRVGTGVVYVVRPRPNEELWCECLSLRTWWIGKGQVSIVVVVAVNLFDNFE
jgi:hypothetical protein